MNKEVLEIFVSVAFVGLGVSITEAVKSLEQLQQQLYNFLGVSKNVLENSSRSKEIQTQHELGPVSDDIIDNPNQKAVLEIFDQNYPNQIEPLNEDIENI